MLKHLNIKKKQNIVNFDEQKVQINCIKRQDIIMSDDISQFYALSFENRQSMIIFENINAERKDSISFMLIIQNHEFMKT